MKSILIIVIIFSVNFLSAQNSIYISHQGSAIASPFTNNFGSATYLSKPKRKITGSIYLFDNWNNTGVLFTKTDQEFVVKNINLNIERNTFEVKISKDTIFSYNFNNIEKFEINNKVYKNYYTQEGKRVYEIIHESNEFLILKGFYIEYVSGAINPMLNRPNDKYVQKKQYFINKDNAIKPYKLSKKRILKLIADDQERVVKLEQFMKDNGLSYKKSNDIKKGLEYSTVN